MNWFKSYRNKNIKSTQKTNRFKIEKDNQFKIKMITFNKKQRRLNRNYSLKKLKKYKSKG